MRMTLKELSVENFGGIKKEVIVFGERTTIAGPNGAGKTRMQSAFFWLLFGKDVNQRTKFEVRPLDQSNRPIQGLVVSVQATLEVDGREVVLKKEEHERIVRDEHRGYTSKYWVNEVPKPENVYKQAVADMASEDRSRLLTDLMWFCDGLHWSKRRAVLYEMIGSKVGTPQGFDDLIERMNGREISEYKKVLNDRRKLYVKQRDEKPIRMSELQKRLSRYISDEKTGSGVELVAKRTELQDEINRLNVSRSQVRKKEAERQKLIDQKSNLNAGKLAREQELKASLMGDLAEEQVKLRQRLSEHHIEVIRLSEEMQKAISRADARQDNLTNAEVKLSELRAKYVKLKEVDVETTCHACGQTLPEALIEENRISHVKVIENIKMDAQKAKNYVVELRAELSDEQETVKDAERAYEAKRAEHATMSRDTDEAEDTIEQNKKNLPEPDYANDEKWSEITQLIKDMENQIGEPVSEQIEKIDADRNKAERELAELNSALASLDQSKKDAERIEELKAEMKNISQAIADIDAELEQIAAYTVQESLDIEIEVNSKFDGVQWKLFDYQLNGDVNDQRCDATVDGVPFNELSTGEQIKAGVSVVNTLSEHYDCHLPLFIDHDESITLPIETKTQTIKLLADKNVNGLEVR